MDYYEAGTGREVEGDEEGQERGLNWVIETTQRMGERGDGAAECSFQGR